MKIGVTKLFIITVLIVSFGVTGCGNKTKVVNQPANTASTTANVATATTTVASATATASESTVVASSSVSDLEGELSG